MKKLLEIYGGKSHLYQWDLNQKLIVDDDIIREIHFDNGTGKALICETYYHNNIRVVDIPNILLQNYLAIKVYAFCGECVRYERVIQVERRSRPADYIYTETEVKDYEKLEQRLTELEEKGVSQEVVENAVKGYLEENPIEINNLLTTDKTLTLTNDGVLSVNTTNNTESDNTLPITSAGVYMTVGNIEAL